MNRDDWGFSAVAVAAALGAAIALTFGNPRAEHVLVVALLMLAGLTLVMGLMLWRNYKRSDAIPQDEQQSKESVDGGTVATEVPEYQQRSPRLPCQLLAGVISWTNRKPACRCSRRVSPYVARAIYFRPR